jgi:hypothetical protein
MAQNQNDFLDLFEIQFTKRFGYSPEWRKGQTKMNYAEFKDVNSELRRSGKPKHREGFELGDLTAVIDNKFTLIVEFDGGGISVQNLIKLWPYVRQELDTHPAHGVVLCHFSNWDSWGSYRDLWKWTVERISEDESCAGKFIARQFDHGGSNVEIRGESISDSLDWICENLLL